MRQPWFKQTNYIVLLLIFVFPIGLFLMWRFTDWSKLTKSIISGIVCLLFIIVLTDNSKTTINPSPPMPAVTQPSTAVTEVPTIDVDGATKQGDVFVMKTQNASQVIKVRTTQMNGASGDTVTINGQSAKPSISIFTYQTSLQEGDNSFDIVAKNPKGETHAKLIVAYASDTIKGRLALFPSGITIINESGKHYGNCTIQLNDTITTRPYTAKLNNLEASVDTTTASPNYISFSEFAKSTGVRYNPSTDKLQKADISCYDENGMEASMYFER